MAAGVELADKIASAFLARPQLTTWTLASVFALILIRYGLKLLQPKPLPGIPYNKNVGILGDLPELLTAFKKGTARPWFWHMAKRHNSPIVQMFFPPFKRPSIIVVDYHESYDILVRRTKEFDRSTVSREMFSTVVPDHHIAMKSSDHRFKGNKELIKDLMTPTFLSRVSAPAIYNKVTELIDLWELKMHAGQGRPFAAFQDIGEATVDIILAVSFGFDDTRSITRRHVQSLSTKAMPQIADDAKEPVEFARPSLSPDINALVTVNQSLHVGITSPIPRLHHWVLKKTKWRRAFQRKEEILTEEIDKAAKRLADSDDGDLHSKSAMDHMILREMAAARKAGRKPVFNTPSMRDEVGCCAFHNTGLSRKLTQFQLLGFLIGGSETSATTLGWIFKLLADNQEIQAKLRRQLRKSYTEAQAEKRQPTVTELVQNSAAYLDAFIEESLRHARTLPVIMRQANVDTTILGYHVPKGTTVISVALGPSITEPSIPVPDTLRSMSSLANRDRVPNWGEAEIAQFNPERWLKTAEDTVGSGEFDKVEYDGNAGPMLTFGGGLRGCFGKRLAYLQLRIALALLVWNFEFEQCAPELSSYEGYDIFTTMPRQCYVKLKKTVL